LSHTLSPSCFTCDPSFHSNDERALAFPKPPSRPVEEFGSPIGAIEESYSSADDDSAGEACGNTALKHCAGVLSLPPCSRKISNEVILPPKSHILGAANRGGKRERHLAGGKSGGSAHLAGTTRNCRTGNWRSTMAPCFAPNP
jgi:hypothetical protein